jgi:hypothetical protein
MSPRLPRSLQLFALYACLAATSFATACSSDSDDEGEPSAATGSGSGGKKGGSNNSGNAGEDGEGDGAGGDPGSGSGEGGGDSSSGGSGGSDSSGGRGGTESKGGSGGSDTGGTDTGGTGGTDSGPDLEAIARGQALAEDIDVNCSGCHGLDYAGSPLYNAGNITPDEATGIGTWSDAEITAAVTEGIGKDGEPLCATMEPYDFDDGQMRDLIAFLRSLTPVSKTLANKCTD